MLKCKKSYQLTIILTSISYGGNRTENHIQVHSCFENDCTEKHDMIF